MRPLKEFDISFTGLKPGKHQFKYRVNKEFFDAFDYDEYLNSDVEVTLDLLKKQNLLELHFEADGSVEVLCDVSNEPFDQNLNGNLDVVVKFGHEYNNDEEDLIIIPYDEHQINVAQMIFEMIVLAMPSKKVHPGVEDGTLKSEILKKLEELQPGAGKDKEEIDPRWEELKKLITNKKT